jgi:hypothetical protein
VSTKLSILASTENVSNDSLSDSAIYAQMLTVFVARPDSSRPASFLLFTLFGACSWSQSVVIKRVTVIDATGRDPEPKMTVIADGERIVTVEPWRKTHIPRNAVVVDGTGKFLIPGLWDMHVHGASDARAPWSHLLFLANGVVGVRDMSGPPDALAWRTTQAFNKDPAPTIYLGSPIIDGPNPVWPESIVVTDEAQGREVVEQQRERGADFIKVYSRLSRNAYFSIADEVSLNSQLPDSIGSGPSGGRNRPGAKRQNDQGWERRAKRMEPPKRTPLGRLNLELSGLDFLAAWRAFLRSAWQQRTSGRVLRNGARPRRVYSPSALSGLNFSEA